MDHARPHAVRTPGGPLRRPPGPLRGAGRARLRRLALSVSVLCLAAACVPGADRGGEEWVEDEDAALYYLADAASSEIDVLDDDLPALADATSGTWVEGQFTDPHERVPMPAPDDYWLQAALELEPEQTAELVDRAGEDPETLDPEALRAAAVAPVEERMGECPQEWTVIDPLTPLGDDSGYTNITPTGMLVSSALACPDTGQVVVELRQM